MELLTTHINADFDALAAVVAAQRNDGSISAGSMVEVPELGFA